MDSLRQHQSNFDPMFLHSQTRPRGSTSQLCLHKILSIITTVPPPLAAAIPSFPGLQAKESPPDAGISDKNKGFVSDLNIGGLCVSPESKESFGLGLGSSSATALEGGGCSSAAGGGGDRVESEEHGNGVSGNSRIKIEEAEKKSLTLLIEAAKVIFGEFLDSEKSESGKRNVFELKKEELAADVGPNEGKLARRSGCWTAAEMEEDFVEPPSSPVVRSKRGRTQMLPGKYRDSVLEPLTRFPRTRSPILPSKRRRR